MEVLDLGLIYCKRVNWNFKSGTISLKSELGKGTKFYFRNPMLNIRRKNKQK